MRIDDEIAWARKAAAELRARGPLEGGIEGRGYLDGPIARAQFTGVLEFLRSRGRGNQFFVAADRLLSDSVFRSTTRREVAGILDAWADHAEAGMWQAGGPAVHARVAAANDLLEQAGTLLDDKRIHPAAPVMLAGAALEEFLRGLVDALEEKPTGKPGINTYAAALKHVDAINAQDVKDITSWAGQRNAAAHGEFDQLSVERARIMVDGINLFLRQRQSSGTA